MSAPPFAAAEPTTSVSLPHLTWHGAWSEPLVRFVAASGTMPPIGRRLYEPATAAERRNWRRHLNKTGRSLLNSTWHTPVSWVADGGLRRELMGLAQALYEYEMPPGDAAIFTRMLDGHTPNSFLYLLGWLRAALVSLSGGDPEAAVAAPTAWVSKQAGAGALPLHSDMFTAALLFNVFNDAVPGEGATTLLSIEDAWRIARDAGMPDDAIERGKLAVRDSGVADYFVQFNTVFHNEEPWSEPVAQALEDAAIVVHLDKGQGYFVNDRVWLHGRTPMGLREIPWERRHHRLYRMAYNNASLQARAAARKAKGEQPAEPVPTEALMVFASS